MNHDNHRDHLRHHETRLCRLFHEKSCLWVHPCHHDLRQNLRQNLRRNLHQNHDRRLGHLEHLLLAHLFLFLLELLVHLRDLVL
ncbi:hypothetical protein BT96DRAFT_926377 [Gymnopus androsaceus JB14]|uniref:Uncharacterized protein n=1 Tax=Gymnopus androsaceus JB14 TaxID=1447944 RepID=A0A6A4GXD3_9AGAR|nr:hypothetical protein BT96DRAFT_926377 [Gymnopus androsaceus JB14]